jgi:hypothetical protein
LAAAWTVQSAATAGRASNPPSPTVANSRQTTVRGLGGFNCNYGAVVDRVNVSVLA